MILPILRFGDVLVATVHSALEDADWQRLLIELPGEVAKARATGLVFDVSALDVLDSFATRMLRDVARATQLKGAVTVVVGIQPSVAFSMVQLGLARTFGDLRTALDLEDGLALLEQLGHAGSR